MARQRRSAGRPAPIRGTAATKSSRTAAQFAASRALDRTASFAFYVGDRYFGVITASVEGSAAADYRFTSELPLAMLQQLAPLIEQRLAATGAEPARSSAATDRPASSGIRCQLHPWTFSPGCSARAATPYSSPAQASAPNPAYPISAVPAACGARCSRSTSRSSSPPSNASRSLAAAFQQCRWLGRCPAQSRSPRRGELIRSGRASGVVTQNVDNLHQVSGVPEEKVIELHGNSTYAKCLKCQTRDELAEIEREFRSQHRRSMQTLRRHHQDGDHFLRPADARATDAPCAGRNACACDLFLVLGSSLSVFPAADFPVRAKQSGAKLVIVNRDPTAGGRHRRSRHP